MVKKNLLKRALRFLQHPALTIASLLALLVACGQPLPENPASDPAFSAEEIRYHVNFLASDELEGRAAGSRGEQVAGRYIAREFRRYGLKPAGTAGYFQPFGFVSDVRLGPDNQLSVTVGGSVTAFEPDHDFRPLAFSANGAVSAGATFVGYGIAAEDLGYDDYEGVDVEGRVVLMLRYGPEGDDPHSRFDPHTPLVRKATVAAEHGAAAVLIVTGPLDGEEENLIPLRLQRLASAPLPVLSITREVAGVLLAAAGKSLEEVQEQINQAQQPQSFEIPEAGVALSTDVRKIRSSARNVLAFLEGSDPEWKREVVIIGAHYDHLGYGGEGSLAGHSTRAIHNGADDNASGTAAVLELAQRFAAAKDSLRRSLLFAAFSGEELGLLGSAHYVRNPVVPLEQTIAMLNLDMVGRLRDSSLVVMGVGSSPVWEELLQESLDDRPLKLSLREGGTGPSDHASFYLKGVPVLFFFTGQHEDYHKPSDDPEKINAEGEAHVVRFVYDIAVRLANEAQRIQFTRVDESEEQPAGRRRFRVYVGTIPDYAAEGEKGMRISGVSAGSPAEEAGLQAGDVIVRFGETPVRNIYDYMYALSRHKAGEKVPVKVRRDGREVVLKVELRKR